MFCSRFVIPAILGVASVMLANCGNGSGGGYAYNFPTDSAARRALFLHYMHEGNRAYAENAGYPSFQKSLRYFDSVRALALAADDTGMLIDAVFARGRIYDAWNKQPHKTIEYFSEAAALMRTRIDKVPRYGYFYPYLCHLTAHAYQKAGDTAGATRTLRALYADLATLLPAARDTLNFIPEMALVSTEVGAWSLADSILTYLTRRAIIKNDPETYNYLDHYYLTQARLDAYHRRNRRTLYADSLAAIWRETGGWLDRRYISNQLAALYDALDDVPQSQAFLKESRRLDDSIETDGSFETMQTALLRSETAAERRKTEYEAGIRAARTRTLWGLAAVLVGISVVALHLWRRGKKYRAQSAELRAVNKQLDEKVAQVELLNKEIQHRVKNNLHMIYSLLHMQERRTHDVGTVAQLQAARLRVESIAALHNQLLAGKGSLDFEGYMRSLISGVVACLPDEKKVVTHIRADNIYIPQKAYMPLSLILNEWVTNSVKYAAPAAGKLLEITVIISHKSDEACIDYCDNGAPPIPAAAAPEGGLGTRIVELLVRQICGELSADPAAPYKYTLCIPYGDHHTGAT